MGDEGVWATMKYVCGCTTECISRKEEYGLQESVWAMRKCMKMCARR